MDIEVGNIVEIVSLGEDPGWHPTQQRYLKVGEQVKIIRIHNNKLWYEVPYHVFKQCYVMPENVKKIA